MGANMMQRMAWAAALVLVTGACGGGDDGAARSELSGSVEIDGSSTVYPITEAVAEEFGIEHGGAVRVTVGVSGTGGGFKRFCAGETQISNASRAISETETALCAQNGIEFIEVPVAIDGLVVVVNSENTAVECLTVDELKRLWEPNSQVSQWSQLRQGLPAEPIKLYGPGTNSGTFDYFTEEIMGEVGSIRTDFSASVDDNVLVQGVAGDRNAIGYFGYAYYQENQGTLRAVQIDDGQGCIAPTLETVTGGQYTPLSRPLFIYVSRAALERPEVMEFVRFYVQSAGELAPDVGYMPLDAAQYEQGLSQLGQGGAS
jgi:phosphate transport system substrate-binding protein